MCHNNNLRKVGGSMGESFWQGWASTHFDGRYRELFNINNYYFIFRQFIEQFSKVVRLITRTITCRKINDTALARITATHIPKNTLFSCVNEAEIIH
ncbi:unnamed protein product [Rhizophagus irregularis]|nr:unnamed protein product [Rhizophagus irregularis]